MEMGPCGPPPKQNIEKRDPLQKTIGRQSPNGTVVANLTTVLLCRFRNGWASSRTSALRGFSSNQAALVEFGAREAASLQKDVLWTDEPL